VCVCVCVCVCVVFGGCLVDNKLARLCQGMVCYAEIYGYVLCFMFMFILLLLVSVIVVLLRRKYKILEEGKR